LRKTGSPRKCHEFKTRELRPGLLAGSFSDTGDAGKFPPPISRAKKRPHGATRTSNFDNPELVRDANDRHVPAGVAGFFAVAEEEVAAAGGAQVADEDIPGI